MRNLPAASLTLSCAVALAMTAILPVAAQQSGSTGPQMQHRSRVDHTMDNRMTTALNLLVANNYFGVSSIKPQGDVFIATAEHEGRPVTVRVDPTARTIEPTS